MLCGKRGDAVVDFAPHFIGRDGTKFTCGNLDGEIELAPVAYLHDDRSGPSGATQKIGDEFDRFLRGGKSNPCQRLASQMVEAFEGKREVGATFVIGYSVDFVHDDGFDSS